MNNSTTPALEAKLLELFKAFDAAQAQFAPVETIYADLAAVDLELRTRRLAAMAA